MSDHLIVQPSPPKRGGTRRGPRVTIVQLLFRAMQRWQRRRATANLQGLTDGQLADIGLSRNDIPRVVEGLIWPKGEAAPVPTQAPAEQPSDELRKAA
ncbi:DUF1127 domain-containing protein [Mesorhizobium sp. YM1C-6-2]|uniref:DUF1127 domain-containing protein n=1 Tax=Mesorhizobium sp. YM1C-6-2 TaxID=1827501 RepID=UPI001AED03C2|nr:DUF1127 domain-containing protein [Mesorhizobium sp. YM1C-6-2]